MQLCERFVNKNQLSVAHVLETKLYQESQTLCSWTWLLRNLSESLNYSAFHMLKIEITSTLFHRMK